ncbi:MAG: 16S rRNA (guanine(527)-N(7))-methyltransferase RsmG [Chloroflexi bacterium]|nr:16S rRNA (guanine(527)-N(7))-methyltransferase RsmG [Chloroflexota bacterium]
MEFLKQEALATLGLALSDEQMAAYAHYATLLAEWNTRINLTAIHEPNEVRVKHFLDSLSCAQAFATVPGSLVDVGTGAGFPGLVLKVLYPAMRLTLVESVSKKATFLEHIVQELGLTDVTILARRAEEVGQDPTHREQYEWAVGRAVAQLPTLAEYLLPLVRIGGWMLAQKGESGRREAREARRAIEILGGGPPRLEQVQLPGLDDERYLIIVKKEKGTPGVYPRLPGTPAKKPL